MQCIIFNHGMQQKSFFSLWSFTKLFPVYLYITEKGSFKKYVTARGWRGGVLVFFVTNRYENFGGVGGSDLYSGT